MILTWNVSIYWKLQNASEVQQIRFPIQSEEAPSPGATASEMATDILHSVYIMLQLFFILTMSIARRCHGEFIMRSFFTFFPDTRSYSSEENLKNERFQRHKDNAGRTVSSRMRTDSSTDRLLELGKSTLAFTQLLEWNVTFMMYVTLLLQ